MIRAILCLAVLLTLSGCGACRQDTNFGFTSCGPLLLP